MGALIGRQRPLAQTLAWQAGGLWAARRRHPQATISRASRLCRQTRLAELVWIKAGASLAACHIGRASRIAGSCRRLVCGHFCAIARDTAVGVPPPGWRYDDPLPITRLGHDVWIAQRATIQAGVRIGTGAVIATSAVVTSDVAPYTLVTGVPALPRRQRFPDALCAALLASAWWTWPPAHLRSIAAHFDASRPLDAAAWQAILDEVGA